MVTQSFLRLLFILLVLFSIPGCGGRPWTDALGEKESDDVEKLFHQMRAAENLCFCCLEADITITLNSPLEKTSIGGYLQLMTPSSIKFIMTNPLGQPVFALTTNGKTFKSINTLKRKFLSGGLGSLMLHHNTPAYMLSENWVAYLTGRIPNGTVEIVGAYNDRENRGIWLTVRLSDGVRKRINHLLIDKEERKLLTRMIVNEIPEYEGSENESYENEDSEEIIAIITYDDWLNKDNCRIPTRLNISKLSFGSQVNIHLSEISTNLQLKPNNFTIKPPPGYLRQFLP